MSGLDEERVPALHGDPDRMSGLDCERVPRCDPALYGDPGRMSGLDEERVPALHGDPGGFGDCTKRCMSKLQDVAKKKKKKKTVENKKRTGMVRVLVVSIKACVHTEVKNEHLEHPTGFYSVG